MLLPCFLNFIYIDSENKPHQQISKESSVLKIQVSEAWTLMETVSYFHTHCLIKSIYRWILTMQSWSTPTRSCLKNWMLTKGFSTANMILWTEISAQATKCCWPLSRRADCSVIRFTSYRSKINIWRGAYMQMLSSDKRKPSLYFRKSCC